MIQSIGRPLQVAATSPLGKKAPAGSRRPPWAAALAALGLLLSAAESHASLTVTGTTGGVFQNAQPGGSTYSITQGGTDFKWGISSQPNEMKFTGTSFTSVPVETSFAVGSLYYFNGTTTGGESTSVDLKVTLNFTVPNVGNESSAFTLSLITTPNTGNAQQNADYVVFPSSFSSTVFALNGVNYTLQVTGFTGVTSGGFTGGTNNSEFHVLEGQSATATLNAMVTANIPGAPEPSTIVVAMTGLGTLGLAGMRRLRRSKAETAA